MTLQQLIKRAYDDSPMLQQELGSAGCIQLKTIANHLITNAVRYCEENPHEIFKLYQAMERRVTGPATQTQSEIFLFAVAKDRIDSLASVQSAKTTRYTKVLAVEFTSEHPAPGLGPDHFQTLTLKDITDAFYKYAK